MSQVVFEFLPCANTLENFLGTIVGKKPDLERGNGLVGNHSYKSLTRAGWFLSLSTWREERSVVRWRTNLRHLHTRCTDCDLRFADYRLWVGSVADDSQSRIGTKPLEQGAGPAKVARATLSIISVNRTIRSNGTLNFSDRLIEFDPVFGDNLSLDMFKATAWAANAVSWDVFEKILNSRDLLLLTAWPDEEAARTYENRVFATSEARMRRIRVQREYSKLERRGAPQLLPPLFRERNTYH